MAFIQSENRTDENDNSTVVIVDTVNPDNSAQVDINKNLTVKDVTKNEGIYGTISVDSTPKELKVNASKLNNRKLLTLDNTSNTVIYWGYNGLVSTSNFAGRIFKDEFMEWATDLQVFVVAASNGNSVKVSEAS